MAGDVPVWPDNMALMTVKGGCLHREMKAEKGGIRSKLEKAKEEVKAGELLGTSEKKMKDASLAI